MSDIKDIADFIVWNRNALDELQTKNPQLSEAVKAVLLELTQKYTGVQIPQGTLSVPTDNRVYDSSVNLPQEIKEKILGNFDRFKFLSNVINAPVLSPESDEKVIYSVVDIEEVQKFSGPSFILYFKEINFLNAKTSKYFKVEISNLDQFIFSAAPGDLNPLYFEILQGASKNITIGKLKPDDWVCLFPKNTLEYIEDFLFQVPYYLVTIDGKKQKLYYNGMKFEFVDFPVLYGSQSNSGRYQKVYSFEDRSNNNYYYIMGDQLFDFLCSQKIDLYPQLNKTTVEIYLDMGLRSSLLYRVFKQEWHKFGSLIGTCLVKDKFCYYNAPQNFYFRYQEVVKNNARNKEFKALQTYPYNTDPQPYLRSRDLDDIDRELKQCFDIRSYIKYLPVRYDELLSPEYFDSLDFETSFSNTLLAGVFYRTILSNETYNKNLKGMKFDPKPLKKILENLDCYEERNKSNKYKIKRFQDIWVLYNMIGTSLRCDYEFNGVTNTAAMAPTLINNLELTLLKPSEKPLTEYALRRFQNEFFFLFVRHSSFMTPSSYFRNTPILPLINSVRILKDNKQHLCSVLQMAFDEDKNCLDICVTSSTLNHEPIYLTSFYFTPSNNTSKDVVSIPINFSSSIDSIFVTIGDTYSGTYHNKMFTDGKMLYVSMSGQEFFRYQSEQMGRNESGIFGRVIPKNQRVVDIIQELSNVKLGTSNVEIEVPVYITKVMTMDYGVILGEKKTYAVLYNQSQIPKELKLLFEAQKEAIQWGGALEARIERNNSLATIECVPATFLTNDEFRNLAYGFYNKEVVGSASSTHTGTTAVQIKDTVKEAMKEIGERYKPGDRVNNGNVIEKDIDSFDWPSDFQLYENTNTSGYDEINMSYFYKGIRTNYTIWSEKNGFAEIVDISKGTKSKKGSYKQTIATIPEELEFDLSLAPNIGDRKSPSQSAGDLQDRFRQNSKIYKYIQNVLFMGNDGLFYKVTETAKGDWRWTKVGKK
jgi:hypothetical protein